MACFASFWQLLKTVLDLLDFLLQLEPLPEVLLDLLGVLRDELPKYRRIEDNAAKLSVGGFAGAGS